MCWKCDHPDSTIEEWLAVIRETVDKHGWAVQYVEDDCSWCGPTGKAAGRGRPRFPAADDDNPYSACGRGRPDRRAPTISRWTSPSSAAGPTG